QRACAVRAPLEPPGEEIHCDYVGRDALIAPLLELPASALERPAAKRRNRAGAFGHRNERAGADQPALRMAPAQQRLDAGNASRVQLDLRLVEQLELLCGDRRAELVGDVA